MEVATQPLIGIKDPTPALPTVGGRMSPGGISREKGKVYKMNIDIIYK